MTIFAMHSFIYIGGCEGKGKINDSQFHIAAFNDLIERVNERRRRNGLGPLKTVIIITDRCPSQFVCRQNIFHILKSGTVIIHISACKRRFKGKHDAEGGVIKQGNEKNVQRGEAGATLFEFYEASGKYSTLTEKQIEARACKEMKISSREILFVSYTEQERDSLSTGQNRGKVDSPI